MIIYLIRHGESTSDIENRYGGEYDDNLTEKGKDEANELADKLIDCNIEKVYTSPKLRAKQVAEILKDKVNCDMEVIENLKERNRYGVLSGTVKNPKFAKQLEDYKECLEGGESHEDFRKRILKSLNNVVDKDHKTIAIVTHGGPIKLILRELFDKKIDSVGNCQFFYIRYK